MSLIAAAAVDGAIGVAHALAFLLAFGALTTLTMTAVAFVWGRTLGTGLARVLKCAGGVLVVLSARRWWSKSSWALHSRPDPCRRDPLPVTDRDSINPSGLYCWCEPRRHGAARTARGNGLHRCAVA